MNALNTLQKHFVKTPDDEALIFPNPTTGSIEIVFSSPPENVTVELISISGKLIFKKTVNGYAGRTLIINELQHYEQGLYLLRLSGISGIVTRKVIKLNNK
jgi:hypothetical protein